MSVSLLSFQFLRGILFCTLAGILLVSGDLSPPSDNLLEAPTVRIDPRLRKALLKALNNLEQESSEQVGTTENFFTTTESEELLEESTTSDRISGPQNVQYTAFTFDRNSSESDAEDNTIYKTIIVPKTTLSPPKENPIVVFSEPDPVKEEDIQIETVQLARSVSTNIQANEIIGNKVSDTVLALSKQALTSTTSAPATTTTTTTTTPSTTTTPKPTTTTTEAPVTNADGENIEKVNDVQIHQAPLVAAFTVAQDAQGLPKSVVPIFKQIIEPVQTNQPQKQAQRTPIQTPVNFAVNPYQFALEAKQRELEQRIHFLQAQQRHQEALFRQQQQQLFFEQQRYRVEENQRQIQRFEQEQRFRLQSQPQQPLVPFLNRQGPIQIIPSISLNNNNQNSNNPGINNNNNQGLPVDQQLPSKDAGTFRITNDQQLPFLHPANFQGKDQAINKFAGGPLQLQQQLQLPQRPYAPFNTQVSIVPSISAQLKNNNIDQGQLQLPFEGNPLTRVFRHGNSPAFEQHQSQQIYVPPHASAQNLHQLLFQSGVATRSNEDLNIISRVLALNHGIQAPLNGNFIQH